MVNKECGMKYETLKIKDPEESTKEEKRGGIITISTLLMREKLFYSVCMNLYETKDNNIIEEEEIHNFMFLLMSMLD